MDKEEAVKKKFLSENRTIDRGVNKHLSCAKPTRGKLTKRKLIKIQKICAN